MSSRFNRSDPTHPININISISVKLRKICVKKIPYIREPHQHGVAVGQYKQPEDKPANQVLHENLTINVADTQT